MQTIVILSRHGGRPCLAVRRHDLSGVDYDHVATIDEGVAQALEDRGLCLWSDDVALAAGRPAVVLHPAGSGRTRVEVRADAADPTTVIAGSEISSADARCCVGPGETHALDRCGRGVPAA